MVRDRIVRQYQRQSTIRKPADGQYSLTLQKATAMVRQSESVKLTVGTDLQRE